MTKICQKKSRMEVNMNDPPRNRSDSGNGVNVKTPNFDNSEAFACTTGQRKINKIDNAGVQI